MDGHRIGRHGRSMWRIGILEHNLAGRRNDSRELYTERQHARENSGRVRDEKWNDE